MFTQLLKLATTQNFPSLGGFQGGLTLVVLLSQSVVHGLHASQRSFLRAQRLSVVLEIREIGAVLVNK